MPFNFTLLNVCSTAPKGNTTNCIAVDNTNICAKPPETAHVSPKIKEKRKGPAMSSGIVNPIAIKAKMFIIFL